jgi:hypothetical protein
MEVGEGGVRNYLVFSTRSAHCTSGKAAPALLRFLRSFVLNSVRSTPELSSTSDLCLSEVCTNSVSSACAFSKRSIDG